jgi:hypothetical protein
MLGLHALEAIRDAINGWYLSVIGLRQAGHTGYCGIAGSVAVRSIDRPLRRTTLERS